MVVANDPASDTWEWLASLDDGVTVLKRAVNRGPAGGYNGVLRARPSARFYTLLNDDLILGGGELGRLVRTLEEDDRIGLASGVAATEEGTPLAESFHRRPLQQALEGLWERWWGHPGTSSVGNVTRVDAISGSNMVLRGRAARQIGEFDEALWPAGFEDLDYVARLRFRGWEVVVHRGVTVPETVSATTRRVFGAAYERLRRESGLLYAALNYPLPVAVGRLAEASVRALTAGEAWVRRGDARGLLRCARLLPHILRGRQRRAFLRRLRSRRPPWEPAEGLLDDPRSS